MFEKTQYLFIMKKLSLLFSVFILLTAFTCENEPLEGDFVTDEPSVTCEQALMNTATAAQNFAALTEENYEEEYSGACSTLKTAFENQLEACGDPDGSLQAAIDALGTCNLNASPCEIATSAAATAQQVLNQATEEEYADACNAYAFVLQQKINECGDEDGSIQDIIDGLGDCMQSNNNQVGELYYENLTEDLFSALISYPNVSGGELPRVQINLYNVTFDEIDSGEDFNNLVNVYLELELNELQTGTYTEFYDFQIIVNGVTQNGSVIDATTILISEQAPEFPDNVVAENGSITINNVTDTTIDLTFTFTRVDGEVVSGFYIGEFQ